MNKFSFFALAFALVAQVAGAKVPIPDLDPFYFPPAGYESTAPGTVFKNRPVSSGMIGVSAVQVLYRTTDANNNPAATVATILSGPKSTKSILVSYQDFEDAANNTCSPSYLFSTGQPGVPFGPTFGNEVPGGLKLGWTIVIPDYEGIKSSFAVGHLEGYAVLDGIRAALNYAPAGINKDAAIGGIGYSGGALATSWAAALQKNYAPELNVKGWAFGGTPANTTAVLQAVDGTIFAGFGAAGAVGLISAHEEVAARYREISTPTGQAALKKVASQCAIADLTGFAGERLQSTKYQTLGNRVLYDPVIMKYLRQNILGVDATETPIAPVFMYHSTKDEVIPYAPAKFAVDAWCANGATVNFTTETGGAGHAGLLLAYGQNAINWLDLRVKGSAPPSGCTLRSISMGGLPFKRSEDDDTEYLDSDVLDRFGPGDAKIVELLEAQSQNGEPVDFMSFLRSTEMI